VWETKFHSHRKQQVYNRGFMYFNVVVFREETARQKTLNRMVATVPLIWSALNAIWVHNCTFTED
jgi:hypothetical protein